MKQKNETHTGVPKRSRWIGIGAFALIFCIMASLAMVHEYCIFGHSVGEVTDNDLESPVSITADGVIVNTTSIGGDILGYGGTVPLEIYISKGVIDSVKALPNNESPRFFDRLYDKGLMTSWNGRTLEEASTLKVDGVSGATYSSNAVIGNVRAGVAYAMNIKEHHPSLAEYRLSLIAALLVILAGAIIPLFVKGNRRYRLIQQLLNVAVLGFWAGVFIDYAMLLNFFAHGLIFTLAGIVTVVLLIVGLLYPVFNKPGHYCTWICPFGSLQELAGKVSKRKLKIGPRTLKALDTFRSVLWVVLLSFLFIGWGVQWIDYEIFTGFLVKSASLVVISVGAVFVILSVFVNRPFCRFVCPTGTLLRLQ